MPSAHKTNHSVAPGRGRRFLRTRTDVKARSVDGVVVVVSGHNVPTVGGRKRRLEAAQPEGVDHRVRGRKRGVRRLGPVARAAPAGSSGGIPGELMKKSTTNVEWAVSKLVPKKVICR